ncbi:MAG: FAD-binding oxidoreductase [Pseudanabaenaceae cyanobacterium]
MLREELTGIEIIDEPAQLEKLSQDYLYFSPILQPLLAKKRAHLVARPSNEAEVIRVASVCAKYRVPLTVRGAGTGNYGQCVPLKGGVVLDMTKMSSIKSIDKGIAHVEAGAKMWHIEREARKLGYELRMFPSTVKTATIGGFIGGGSGGIGSLRYGQLRDRGNLQKVRVISLTENPQIIELEGEAVQQVNHAYGTNGIITELVIPLGVAVEWYSAIAVFQDFMTCARFGQTLGNCDGIVCRMISVHSAPIPSYFIPLQNYVGERQSCALILIAENDVFTLQELVKDCGGQLTYSKPAAEGISLFEFSWNHTTLHARTAQPDITYLQALFVDDPQLQKVEHLYHKFAGEVFMHLEFIRMQGKVIPAAIPLVHFTTVERINEIIHYWENLGVLIANPHTYILEDGGMKSIDEQQLAFKKRVDPYNLMNVGKMRAALENYS